MKNSVHDENRATLTRLRHAMYDFEFDAVRRTIDALFEPDARIRLAFPFDRLEGPEGWFDEALAPLATAWPDIERRDVLVISGGTEHGDNWVGCAGTYSGTFLAPWLDIPPTGHVVAMRFHEFYRIVDSRIVELQALWDIPEVMMQARAWPLAPSLGREWQVPGPATQDGIVRGPRDAAASDKSCGQVVAMLGALKRHPRDRDPASMDMPRYWHPRMNWYGPAGIGTGRGIAGFRHWHQIPFLNAMPDRGQQLSRIRYHFFGDGNYVGVTGWPNMIQTHSHDGWLGIPPTGREITMRSLDFWRLENGLIRENWVLVDLLDAYRQLGVDVFARLREFNKARSLHPIELPDPLT